MPPGYDYPSSSNPQYRPPIGYLDLYEINDTDKVAPNFQINELAQDWKGQFAVLQRHAVDSLQAVRDQVGVLIVNSGYRSPAYNASVGGATYSRHMYGDAFDLYPQNVSLGTLGNVCGAKGAFVILYSNHVHCDWRYVPLDPVFFGPPPSGKTIEPFLHPEAFEAFLEEEDGRWFAPAFGWDEGEPLREWKAWDAKGILLDRTVGESYLPPAGTQRLEVRVGGRLTLEVDLQ
ncbi:MAG: DUF882 domain-containing protein [Deltaproteobacteria bacterium]|nr:MAG: DUF882 domain-containing protein [Deltaproteobacteria bacterium]